MSPPNVSLASLNPELKYANGAVKGVEFDCPGCVGTERAHRVYMGLPHWKFTGSTVGDITFIDSDIGTRSLRCFSPCHSHFNVTRGVIDHYQDSHSP